MRRALRTLARAARDEARLLRRERSVLLVLLGVPLLYPAVIAALYRAEDARERPAVVVDLDGSALARRLAFDLDATPELRVVARAGGVDAARAAVAADDAELAVVIPADLSARVARGETAQLAVWAGGANLYTWGVAFPAVHAVAGAAGAELRARAFLEKGLPPPAARARATPIATADRPLFHPSGSYGRYFGGGVLLIVLQQVVLLSTAFSAGLRRELRLAPLDAGRPLAEAAGRAAAHAPFWAAAALFVVAGVLPAVGWSGPGVAPVAALVAAFLVAMVPIAMAVARFVRDRMAAFQLLMFLSVPLFVASGFTWPAGALPAHVRAVAAVFPATPALRAFRILSMKAADLAAVAPELAWLAAQLAGWTAVAAVVLRPRRAEPERRTSPENVAA